MRPREHAAHVEWRIPWQYAVDLPEADSSFPEKSREVVTMRVYSAISQEAKDVSESATEHQYQRISRPMPPFAFVHAADLHLDSPFSGIGRLPDEQKQIVQSLREATFEAFEAVIDLCIHRKADFLLVAGDVYDGAERSLRAQLRFRDGLQRLRERGIRAYVVHGNHDPLDGWSHALQMPDTVHVRKSPVRAAFSELHSSGSSGWC